jgi:hypothetical protein
MKDTRSAVMGAVVKETAISLRRSNSEGDTGTSEWMSCTEGGRYCSKEELFE